MKFTNIFDVTDDESQADNDNSHMIHYDSESAFQGDMDQQSVHDLEAIISESVEIMPDWRCAAIKVDEINSNEVLTESQREDLSPTGSSTSIESMDSFYKPEADQKEHDQTLSEHVHAALLDNVKDYATVTRDIDD